MSIPIALVATLMLGGGELQRPAPVDLDLPDIAAVQPAEASPRQPWSVAATRAAQMGTGLLIATPILAAAVGLLVLGPALEGAGIAESPEGFWAAGLLLLAAHLFVTPLLVAIAETWVGDRLGAQEATPLWPTVGACLASAATVAVACGGLALGLTLYAQGPGGGGAELWIAPVGVAVGVGLAQLGVVVVPALVYGVTASPKPEPATKEAPGAAPREAPAVLSLAMAY